MPPPLDLRDVLEARRAIAPYLRPTPLVRYPALDALLGAQVFVKREDTQPIGAFKVRGGVNLLAHLTPEERARGVVTASTGNHGQSLAYACRLFGVRCVVVVPEQANPLKVEAMRRLGAEVRFHGQRYDDARTFAEGLAREEGLRYVHPSNEPLLIAGVATQALEMLEEVPDLDLLFVSLGGGSGAAGACIVAHALGGHTKVVAVQSAQAPAGYQSWRARRIVSAPNTTFAEGLATSQGYELPQSILWDLLDDFLLVDDDEIRQAVYLYLDRCRTLAEPAGATSLAGALKVRDRLAGKKVGLVLSGANITLAQLKEVIARVEGSLRGGLGGGESGTSRR